MNTKAIATLTLLIALASPGWAATCDYVPAGRSFLLRTMGRRAGRGGQEKGDNEENENGQRNPPSRGLLQEGCLETGSATTTSRLGAAPT